MFKKWTQWLSKLGNPKKDFWLDGKHKLAEVHDFNCIMIMPTGQLFFGKRYLDSNRVCWKYYFIDFSGEEENTDAKNELTNVKEIVTYEYPCKGYHFYTSDDNDKCVFEKYNDIEPCGVPNTYIMDEFSDRGDNGPIIFVKTNGNWNALDIYRILK